MKIGIMGTHGTGKTTFALQTAADLKQSCPGSQVGLLSEIARKCPFPTNKDTSIEAQLWIFHAQMQAELEMSARNEILVCDRTILDSLAYSREAGLVEMVDEYFYIAIDWLKTYDHLYYCIPRHEIADDGFRAQDPAFQARINIILKEWVDRYHIPVTIVGEQNAIRNN